MNRVLVTGARGFIGAHCLAPLIARGYEVHAVSRRVTAPTTGGVVWHEADLLEAAAAVRVLDVVRPSHLLHLAWYVVPGKLITSDENYAWVSASVALVRKFAAFGGTRLVAAGSSYEYDWNHRYCSETHTPLTPNTVYGACKHALHVMLEAAARTSPFSLAWARIFSLYGPDEHPDRLVSYVIRSLLAEQPAKCSSGTQLRDYLYVQDVADALVAVLDSDIQGPINIASGVPVSLRQIALSIGRMIGRESLVELGAIPSRANDSAFVVGNVDRLTSELSWKPTNDLERGLERTIEWWRAQAQLAIALATLLGGGIPLVNAIEISVPL
jgi:nucleoside-diphosphate-sugar epimerase